MFCGCSRTDHRVEASAMVIGACFADVQHIAVCFLEALLVEILHPGRLMCAGKRQSPSANGMVKAADFLH